VVNSAGLALIKASEGLRLDAYDDGTGVWTIGYGHTPAKPGQRITQAQAESLLVSDVAKAEAVVDSLVKVTLSANQRAAIVSFTFNLGGGALAESTLLRLLNRGLVKDAAMEFTRWDKATVEGKLVALPGLTKRREAEKALFLTTDGPAKPSPAPTAPVPLRLFAPADDSKVSRDLSQSELDLVRWISTRLGLHINESIPGKVFLAAGTAKARLWKVEPLAQSNGVSCGQTSVAMACNALTGKMLRDTDIHARYGFSLLAALNGESGQAYVDGGNLDASKWSGIESRLVRGPIVIGLNGPDFSPSGRGHIVLITGVDGGKVTFADPNGGVWRTLLKSRFEQAPPHPDGKFIFWPA